MSGGMRSPGSIRLLATFGAITMLASCVAPERGPRPTAPPPAAAPVIAPASDDWRDLARTPGDWRWSADRSADGARFLDADDAPMFAIRCDAATREIRLVRAGSTADGTATMAFTTSAAVFAIPAAAAADTPGALVARIAASDPKLDDIAFSRGRFVVAVTGQPRLVLPAAPEIGRVIEDCRG